jgi:hypothetical protein
MMLVRKDFTLPFNERIDGSSPSGLKFFVPKKNWDLNKPPAWLVYGLEVKRHACREPERAIQSQFYNTIYVSRLGHFQI